MRVQDGQPGVGPHAAIMQHWRIIITGCGTSHGSPPWGWRHLWSEDPRDHRRRSGAVLLGPAGEVILLDMGPDLMHQLRDPYATWRGYGYPEDCITRCDGVLLTHDHADHSHGINELRHVNRLQDGRPITIYGHRQHLDLITQMFPYCFDAAPDEVYRSYKPALTTCPVTDGTPFTVAGVPVVACALWHGPAGRVNGYRIGSLAYCSDAKSVPEATLPLLEGLDLLVLGMLREQPHETHMHLAAALDLVDRLRPQRTVFVHMGPEMRWAQWQGRLPAGVELAFDGLEMGFTVP